ncbi:MAG: hypothetical protein QHC65_14145 [Sphingomonas sp.]|nr:ImmA/IrrE family metallo-endopeptidase [Sphingomonas sp.]MDX3885558.1 hypothetical protein [Sphingomonas sp.]
MLISHEEIIAAFNKVRVIKEQLDKACPGPQGPVLRVMDLAWVVGDVYDLQINMLEVDFHGEHLKGMCERYGNNTARVFVRANLSLAEKRLVAVKEICHLFLDEEDDWSTVGAETIEGLLTDITLQAQNGEGLAKPPRPLVSESLALLAAHELVYPRMYRDADFEKLAKGTATTASVALQHEIPPYVVGYCYRHHEVIDAVWAQIHAALDKAA